MQLTEKILDQITETFIHKKHVLDSCYKMAMILHERQEDMLALSLLRRAITHDNSKLSNEELLSFSMLENTKDALQEADRCMDDKTKEAIKVHWKNNRHHPEFFSHVDNMEELDILEMCCDWHARSVQYNTDLIQFVKTRQKNRFNFSEQVFEKILHYCELLVEE